jgi:hypothetical protein
VLEPRDLRTLAARDALLVLLEVVVALERDAARGERFDGRLESSTRKLRIVSSAGAWSGLG